MMRSNMMLATMAAGVLLTGCSKTDKGPTQRQTIGQTWKYEEKDGTKLAYIGSANSVKTLTAPDTFAVLLVNDTGQGTTGVTVKTVGAPFTCDLSDCTVEAVADGGKAQTWIGSITENKDGIYIPPARKAFEQIKKADTLRVTVGIGPKEKQAFEFNVKGLDWKV